MTWRLEQIKERLHAWGYASALLAENDERPFPVLAVPLELDAAERPRELTITLIPQSGIDQQLVQWQARFPFQVLPGAAADVARLVAMINAHIEVPGIQYDEVEGELSYRYTLLDAGENTSPLLLSTTLGHCLVVLDFYGGVLETVATGKRGFIDVVEQVVNTLASAQEG